MIIRNAVVGVCLVGMLFLFAQSELSAKSGLECPPQPYPITLPPELADVPGMREFAEHIDRQFEEIYLRFCFHVDSLKDSLVYADSLVLDSVGTVDILPLGCWIRADLMTPCDDEIKFDANKFIFVDDTGGTGGDAQGATINVSFENTVGTRASIWSWPSGTFSTHEIVFPDTIASWSHARWRFFGTGTQKLVYWERDDDVYIQYGKKQLLGSGATPGTTYVDLPVAYSNKAYRVQLTPVDVHSRELWSASWSMGDQVRVWNDAIFAQYDVDTFVILHPVDDTVYIEWATFGEITGVREYR